MLETGDTASCRDRAGNRQQVPACRKMSGCSTAALQHCSQHTNANTIPRTLGPGVCRDTKVELDMGWCPDNADTGSHTS